MSPEALAAAGWWTGLMDIGLVVASLACAIDLWAPPQDLPWKPFRLAAPVGISSRLQFARAAADPALCRRTLDEGGVRFAEAADRNKGFCRVRDAVRITGGTTPLSPAAPQITCSLALAYAVWDRQVLRPAAREVLGGAVARVDHYGSYACRNVYGRAQGRPSEHPFANALDVAGFRLSDGRRITVAADFRKSGPDGRFLRRARDGACPWFRGVLSPDYNAAHRDHLHLDFGPYGVCR